MSLDWQTLCAQRGEAYPECVHLWPAARVYGCHPAWRCAPAGAGWRARGMGPTHARRQGEIGQGCGLSGGGPGVPARAGTRSGGLSGPGSAPCGPTGEAG